MPAVRRRIWVVGSTALNTHSWWPCARRPGRDSANSLFCFRSPSTGETYEMHVRVVRLSMASVESLQTNHNKINNFHCTEYNIYKKFGTLDLPICLLNSWFFVFSTRECGTMRPVNDSSINDVFYTINRTAHKINIQLLSFICRTKCSQRWLYIYQKFLDVQLDLSVNFYQNICSHDD